MIKIQQDLCKILLSERNKLRETKETLKEVSINSIGEWQAEKHSPNLKKIEEILTKNNLELPFFFDGTIESLIDFNRQIAEKKGFKINLTFE